jgi:hypothetical protein
VVAAPCLGAAALEEAWIQSLTSPPRIRQHDTGVTLPAQRPLDDRLSVRSAMGKDAGTLRTGAPLS